MRIDARVPVVFGPVPEQVGDHVLTEGRDFEVPPAVAVVGAVAGAVAGANPPHLAGCACCAGGRNPVAGLLGGLFFARALGTVPFFRRVVVHAGTPGARNAVAEALADDPVVSGVFRPG